MELFDFINEVGLNSKEQSEKAVYLLYFALKERGLEQFNSTSVKTLFMEAGLSNPNSSRLFSKLAAGPSRKIIQDRKLKGTYNLVPIVVERLNRELAGLFNTAIVSDSELLDETKFCNIRGFLDSLIKQINKCYSGNCYDATAVIMRRLFEVLLIMTYQHLGIDQAICDSTGKHLRFELIVQDAVNNKTLNLSRYKSSYNNLKKVGDLSAHGLTYTASRKDINDVKLDYRIMVEELMRKAGLLR